MSNFTQIFRPTASIVPATVLKIYNVVVLLANTEVSQVLSPDVKHFKIRARGTARIQWTLTAGESGTNFLTIARGKTEEINDIGLTAGTLYFQTSEGPEIIEIEEWV